MSLPNPCTRCATELDSLRGYWRYRSFVIIITIVNICWRGKYLKSIQLQSKPFYSSPNRYGINYYKQNEATFKKDKNEQKQQSLARAKCGLAVRNNALTQRIFGRFTRELNT